MNIIDETKLTNVPTITLLVGNDVDAAIIRGEILPPQVEVAIELLKLSVSARKYLVSCRTSSSSSVPLYVPDKYPKALAAFEFATPSAVIERVEEFAAAVEKKESEQAALEARRLQQETERHIAFLKSEPPKGEITVRRNLSITSFGEGFKTQGFVLDGYGFYSSVGREERDAHIEKFKNINAAHIESIKDEVYAFYAEEDAKRAAAEALAGEQEKAEREARYAARLLTGRYSEEFAGYNQKRYGTPWAAEISLGADGSLQFTFVKEVYDGDACGGTVEIQCAPGDIIAIGQKDNRGKNTDSRILKMRKDGSMESLTRPQAIKVLTTQAENQLMK